MPNTLDPIIPKILARGMGLLRTRLIMPRITNGDYSAEAADKGDVINVPVPVSRTSSAVVPSNTPPVPTDRTPNVVQVPLDRWEHADFFLTDRDLGLIDKNRHFVPMEMESAIDALASAVNTSIFDEYRGVYGTVGAPGVTPFASDIAVANSAAALLHEQRCPKPQRRVVLNFAAEANAKNLAPFRDTSQSTDRDVIIEGEIGRKLGSDWFSDHDVPNHVTGAAGTPLVNGAAQSGTTLVVDGFTTVPSVGDVFTVAGSSQQHVVTAATALQAGESSLTISPALPAAPADNAALTFVGDHAVNLNFHRDAFAFATRSLRMTEADRKRGDILSLQDPQTGLVMRLEIMRQYKQTTWDFDILWGTRLVRPELAVRIAG